jgi:hypothetical protein
MTEPLFTLPPFLDALVVIRDRLDEVVFGACSYSSPCAIGVLMPDEVRACIRDAGDDAVRVDELVAAGILACSQEDLPKYASLQMYVDEERHDLVHRAINEKAPQ